MNVNEMLDIIESQKKYCSGNPKLLEAYEFITYTMKNNIESVKDIEIGENGLKPCPFCGKAPDIFTGGFIDEYGDDSRYYMIACRNKECVCEPDTWEYDTEEEAIEVWNRRIRHVI